MNPPVVASTATFVLRFWRETTASESRWRGSIEHVQSGESLSFLNLERMLAFIQKFGIATVQHPPRKEEI